MKESTFLPVVTGILLATASTECLTAGAGNIKPVPGAELVGIVRSQLSVEGCTFLKAIRVSDGIPRRMETRVHEGYEERALIRLQNLAVHIGGNRVLITKQEVRYHPAYLWKFDADVYKCPGSDPEKASEAATSASGGSE